MADPAGLSSVATALDNTARVGLDVETTGLDPRRDRARLLSLTTDTIDGETFTYLIDCFAVDPSPLWESLADKELSLHNAAFDLAFLARLGFAPAGKVHDTMLLAQLLAAGTLERVTLAACCERYLGRTLDKTEQVSDWSGALTESQGLCRPRRGRTGAALAGSYWEGQGSRPRRSRGNRTALPAGYGVDGP